MLDSETPRGKIFIQNQNLIEEYLSSKGYTVLRTSTKTDHADAILGKVIDGSLTVCAVAEIRSRINAGNQKLTVDYLNSNGYLVSKHKIDHGQKASSVLGVPYYLIVNLMADELLLVWKVTDDNGELLFDFDVRETWTKETCNGGRVKRVNCFLPMKNCKTIELLSWRHSRVQV